MDASQTLGQLLNDIAQAINSPDESEAASATFRVALSSEEQYRSDLSRVLAKSLLNEQRSSVIKSILVVLRITGINAEHFPGVQSCLDRNGNDAYLAWMLLADSSNTTGVGNYIASNRAAYVAGLAHTDAQIRAAAIRLLSSTKKADDLRLIAERLLDKDKTVRSTALETILSAGKLADECVDELQAYFKDIDQNCDIRNHISELHEFGPRLADSAITLGDPSALVSLRNKVISTKRELLAESVVQYLSELIGHCGANAINYFPMLKEQAMQTCEFRDVRACIWMAVRCPELIPQTLELIDYVAQNEDESTASQAISDASFLGKSASLFIPRLIEIMNDVNKGGTRSAAAMTLGNIIDKSMDKEVIELLINNLQDKNNLLVYGSCKALGTIFANDPNADQKMLETIAKIAQSKTYDLQNVGNATYTTITGKIAPSEDLPKYDPEAAAKKAFEDLLNEDPFTVMESLNTLQYSQALRETTILAGQTEYISVLWDYAFNTPDRFEPLTKHWAGIDGFKKASMSILSNFGKLAESCIPQLIKMVQAQIEKGEPDEWGWETIDMLAAVGKDNPEVLALFEEQLSRDNGSNWASPLAKMGDAGIRSLINSLHSKTERIQKLSKTDPAFKLLTRTQEHICILLENAGEKALPAVPTMIFIALDKEHQNETARFCGGHTRNNRIYAVQALCKLAPRDPRVLKAFEQLKTNPSEADLYGEIAAELSQLKKLRAEKEKPADLKAKIEEFFEAIQNGDCQKVKQLLAEGIDPNSRNVREGTVADQNDPALVRAARINQNQIIKILIKAGADLNATGHNFNTAIQAACERGNVEAIFHLLNAGSVPRYSPLEFAAVRGDLHLTIGLLLPGVAPGKALTLAAQHGFNRIVEELLHSCKTANKVDPGAMAAAVSNGNLAMAKSLQEASQDDSNNAELLQSAIIGKKFDIAKLLIDADAAKNLRNDFESLGMHKLIEAGQLELVERFLDSGIDPNIRSINATTPLISAAKNGHIEICKLLISRGADPALCDSSGYNLAFAAIESGNTELLKYVLSLGQALNVETDSGQAFSLAARNSHLDMIDFLLELGLDVNGKNFINSTALHDPGSCEVVKKLVAAGANVEGLDGSEETPLIRMSGSSHADIVKALIDAGANIAAEGKWGDTAFSRAKAHNQQASLKVLQDVNAPDRSARVGFTRKSAAVFMTVPTSSSAKDSNINAANTQPKEPIMPAAPPTLPAPPYTADQRPSPPTISTKDAAADALASKPAQVSDEAPKERGIPTTVISITFQGHNTSGQLKELFKAVTDKNLEKTREIIASGFDPNNADDEQRTPLMWAAAGNAVEIVRILLEAGANPNAHREDGTTPLQWAIQNVRDGDTTTVELLLEKGADPNLSGSNLPLNEAVRKKQPEVVEVLLKAGAKIDPRGNKSGQLLCAAANEGSLSIVKILHNAGAKLDAYDSHGFTPLMCSVRHKDVFEYLLENGADVSLPASGFMGCQETAFLKAAAQGCSDAISMLLKHNQKPDLNTRNLLGETALMLAAEKGHPTTVGLLLAAGADPTLKNNKNMTALMLAQKNDARNDEQRAAKAECADILQKLSV